MHRFARLALVAIWIGMQMHPGRAATSLTFHGEQLPPGPPPIVTPPIATPPIIVVPQPSGDTCTADVSERSGIVSLSLDDAARAGRQTTFTLDEITYAASFDDHGHLAAEGPIFHATADLAWTGTGGSECHRRGIAFSNFSGAAFAALVWPAGTVQLGLQVVEPEGRLGGPRGFVSLERPNLDLSAGRGRLLRFGAAVAGTSQVELYTIGPDRNPHQGFVYLFVDFVTRGNPAQRPYCGSGPLATARYKILELTDGHLDNKHGGTFAPVDCGKTWSAEQIESEYLQRWKWGL